jgi:hypothetical protein
MAGPRARDRRAQVPAGATLTGSRLPDRYDGIGEAGALAGGQGAPAAARLTDAFGATSWVATVRTQAALAPASPLPGRSDQHHRTANCGRPTYPTLRVVASAPPAAGRAPDRRPRLL